MEELDLPTDFKDLPTRIDWSAELPANIIVPRVDVHSLVLDFAAVSFLDISALKGLKTVRLSIMIAVFITGRHFHIIYSNVFIASHLVYRLTDAERADPGGS